MKFAAVLFGALLSTHAFADTPPLATPNAPVTPLDQVLTAVDYSENGHQTGCGLRATGTTTDHVWLNVLVTVFMKGTGATFGVIKVVARKVNTKDGVPILDSNGKITYANIGNIRMAWIKPDSGKEALYYKNGEASHADAYMVTTEFASTVSLIAAISQQDFQVGLNRNIDEPDEVFQFDKRPNPGETGKLSVCMKNLRTVMEENQDMQNF